MLRRTPLNPLIFCFFFVSKAVYYVISHRFRMASMEFHFHFLWLMLFKWKCVFLLIVCFCSIWFPSQIFLVFMILSTHCRHWRRRRWLSILISIFAFSEYFFNLLVVVNGHVASHEVLVIFDKIDSTFVRCQTDIVGQWRQMESGNWEWCAHPL